MAWRIRCYSSRCPIFSEPLKISQLMDHIRDHSPNHRHVTVTDLQVRVVRIVGGQCQLAIYFWQSLHRHLAVDRSDHHLADLWLNAFVRHQNVAISHVRFQWKTWDSAKEGGDLVSDQQFIEMNLLGRFAERRLRIAWADALIIEDEGAVFSDGDLLKLHCFKATWNANIPPVKQIKPAGCRFLGT